MTVEVDSPLHEQTGPMRVWENNEPDHSTSQYAISATDSLMRASIYINLIMTHEQTLFYDSAYGLGSYIHMLSAATSAQFALVFSQTNLSLSAWSGYDTRRDDAVTTTTMENAIRRCTNDIASYVGVQYMVQGWGAWDEDVIYEYYGINPFDNTSWNMSHPLPHHFVVQWARKINNIVGERPTQVTYFPHQGQNHMGLPLSDKSLQYRALAYCTTDVDRYFPMLVYREADGGLQHMRAWVDQWSAISLYNTRPSTAINWSFLESEELVITMVDNGLMYAPTLTAYILNSAYNRITEETVTLHTSQLLWPDPITWQDILRGAKNYVLMPALSALGGLVTGGPAGALIAGGAHLAKNIIDDVTSGTKAEKAKEMTDAVAQAAKKIYVNPTHSTTTHEEKKDPKAKEVAEKQNIEKTTVQLSPPMVLAGSEET